VIAFSSVFLTLTGGLFGFVSLQLKHSRQKAAWQEALGIAEAGINYYRWCLNHGLEANCSLQKEYLGADGTPIGDFSLTASSTQNCGEITSQTIVSTGSTKDFPNVKRKIKVQYGRPSVAQYSYVLNNNVWVGSDHEIRGPYHSNGGVRMDGENQSLVTSAKDTWLCTSSFGCSPSEQKPGVFTTANGKEDLFNFPVPPFDFNGITADLAQMKSKAQLSGIYLPPSVDINPSAKGYHLKFLNNGTFEVWIITNLSSTYAYSLEEGWHYDYFTIQNEAFYNTYSIPSACSLIFVEDNIWPEGKIKGKATLASANLISPTTDTNAILQGNINYTTLDGSDGFFLLVERNILIGPNSPNNMELRGVF
ncbi:MAG: hypothetical protein ACK4NX_03590, partial [Candidatus Paceibacteria bacterium]